MVFLMDELLIFGDESVLEMARIEYLAQVKIVEGCLRKIAMPLRYCSVLILSFPKSLGLNIQGIQYTSPLNGVSLVA